MMRCWYSSKFTLFLLVRTAAELIIHTHVPIVLQRYRVFHPLPWRQCANSGKDHNLALPPQAHLKVRTTPIISRRATYVASEGRLNLSRNQHFAYRYPSRRLFTEPGAEPAAA